MDIYATIRDGVGDETAADAVYYNLGIEDAVQALREEAAMAQLPAAQAQLEQAAVELEQRLRARRDQTQLDVATTPDKIVKTVDPFRHERRRIEKRQERIEKHLDDLEMKGVDVAAARDKLAGERDLERAKEAKKDTKDTWARAYGFGKDIEKIESTIKGIDELLQMDDIPGYGFTASPLPEALSAGKGSTNAQIDMVLDELARMKSGAAITEDEWEQYDGMLRGGTTLGGEARLRRNLERVRKFMVQKRDGIEQGLDPEARQIYRRNAQLADFDPSWSGGTANVVVED
jgi:hypothetical protein